LGDLLSLRQRWRLTKGSGRNWTRSCLSAGERGALPALSGFSPARRLSRHSKAKADRRYLAFVLVLSHTIDERERREWTKGRNRKQISPQSRLRPVYARNLVITGGYVGQGTQRARRLDSKREFFVSKSLCFSHRMPLVKPLASYLRVLCVFVVNIPFSLS
jgi:hypothetical protein